MQPPAAPVDSGYDAAMLSRTIAVKPRLSNHLLYALSMLFALPFLGGGALALLQGIRQYGTGKNAIVLIVVGVICVATGLLVVGGLRSTAAANSRSEALQARYPGKPWMWREEWMNRSIRDSNRVGAIGMWIFALFWNAISIPLAVLIAPSELAKGHHAALLILLFPLIGIFVFIAAIYQTLRSIRFGTSTCHLENVPVVPGRKFRGDVEIGNDTVPEDGYHFRIASLQAMTTGSGKNRSTTEHTLWDDEIEVNAAAAMRSPTGVRVPFELATPPDGHTTDESDSSNRYFWRLYATAQFAGVDYAAQFQIPVFQTGEAVDGSEFAAFEQRHRSEAARRQLPLSAGVQITARPEGGEEFQIRAKKTIGGMLRSLLFLVILNAALAALIHYNAPFGFRAVLFLIDLLVILASIDYLFGKTTATVDATGVKVRWECFGAAWTTSYDAAAIASIDGATPGGNNASSFAVKLKLSNGRTRILGGYLPDRESADIVAARMMADLRRA